MHDEGSLCFAVAFKSETFVYRGCQSTDDTGSVGRTSLANRTFTTSSSSSDTVQGSVLLPHYRTLEVRPGRIS